MTEKDALSDWNAEEKIVTISEDGKPIDTITLNFGSTTIKIKESDSYARKLLTILSSPKIKDKLGEQLIASFELKTGMIFQKTTSWYITNYRVFCLDERNGHITQIPLKYVDIVVRNSHSFSQRNGAIAGGMAPGFMYAGMAFTKGESISRKIGDMNFLFQGQIVTIIPNVQDPAGLKQLLEKIKKQIHSGDEK